MDARVKHVVAGGGGGGWAVRCDPKIQTASLSHPELPRQHGEHTQHPAPGQ